MSLAQKAGKAGSLMLFRKIWGALVSFAIMAYLARILNKEDFGIVAISGVLIAFIQVFAISGISEFVIFYKGEDEKQVTNSAFWLNFFAALAITILVVIAAPFWASYYRDERIVNIVYLLVFGFFISMQAAIPMALFRKNLDYKPMILIQTIFGTISNLSQAAFAFWGFGVYSLALPNLIIAPFLSGILIYKSGFRPDFSLVTSRWKQIFNYTKHVIGQRVLGKFVNEGDTFLVGRFFGMAQLGVYNLAFQFSSMFVGHFLPIITNVTMPVFAKNNHDLPTVRHHFRKMIALIAFITLPVIGAMMVGAEFLITTIYGEKWADAVLPFQLLSIYVITRSISSPTSSLFNAMGRPKLGFQFTLSFSIIFIITIALAGYYLGFLGFVIALVVVRVLGSVVLIKLALNLIEDSMARLLEQMKLNLIILAISFGIGFGLNYAFGIGSFICMIAFLLTYVIGLFITRHKFDSVFQDFLRMMPSRLTTILNRVPIIKNFELLK